MQLEPTASRETSMYTHSPVGETRHVSFILGPSVPCLSRSCRGQKVNRTLLGAMGGAWRRSSGQLGRVDGGRRGHRWLCGRGRRTGHGGGHHRRGVVQWVWGDTGVLIIIFSRWWTRNRHFPEHGYITFRYMGEGVTKRAEQTPRAGGSDLERKNGEHLP